MKKLFTFVVALCFFSVVCAQPIVFQPPDINMPPQKIFIDSKTVHIKHKLGYSTIRIGPTNCNNVVLSTCGGSDYVSYQCCGPGTGVDGGNALGGAFRILCGSSHEGFDDPIVKPRQSGASHLHTFFGNTTTDAQSDASKMDTFGNSTCDGGIANRTGYWTPTFTFSCPIGEVGCIVHGQSGSRDGEVQHMTTNNAYYKTQPYDTAHVGSVVWFPKGLRMVSGDPSNVDPTVLANFGGYTCFGSGGSEQWEYIPSSGETGTTCNVDLELSVTFPNCWDGVNLYLPTALGGRNSAHMFYGGYGANCTNPSFPVSFPDIVVNAHMFPKSAADLDYIVLSSDHGPEYGNTQAGSTTTTVVLAASASNVDNYYIHGYVAISSLNVRRQITAYNGSTRTATLASAITTPPGSGVAYMVRQEGGITLHSDWANGWNQDANFNGWGRSLPEQIMRSCYFDNARYSSIAAVLADPSKIYGLNCHDDLLGDPALTGVPYDASVVTHQMRLQ